MKKQMMALALVLGSAGFGVAAGEAAPKAAECQGCVDAHKALEHGQVGACDPCGVAMAKVAKDHAGAVEEAAKKAGAKSVEYKDGMVVAHADKEHMEAVKKALAGH